MLSTFFIARRTDEVDEASRNELQLRFSNEAFAVSDDERINSTI